MKYVIISDTHEKEHLVKLPEGDVLIHCGDSTFRGEFNALAKFATWMGKQDFKYRVCIWGNHEILLDSNLPNFNLQYKNIVLDLFKQNNITVLENSSTIIEGLKIYGLPQTQRFFDWGWNVNPGPEIAKYWDAIPDDTNILISHQPPFSILDYTSRDGSQGCKELLRRIKELKHLKLHCYGHLHWDGCQMVEIDGVKFVNGAMCDDSYVINRIPIVVDL